MTWTVADLSANSPVNSRAFDDAIGSEITAVVVVVNVTPSVADASDKFIFDPRAFNERRRNFCCCRVDDVVVVVF